MRTTGGVADGSVVDASAGAPEAGAVGVVLVAGGGFVVDAAFNAVTVKTAMPLFPAASRAVTVTTEVVPALSAIPPVLQLAVP